LNRVVSLRALQILPIVAACVVVALFGLNCAGYVAKAETSGTPTHFADADDDALVEEGQHVYSTACATCHGRRLEGQALWQLQDQYAGRRAPAHDSTGHTWQHADEDLFHITKFGRFASAPADAESFMPAYEGKLSDHEILAVIAFIKRQWPIGLRASQSMLNPGFAGMPAGADKVKWTLPPNCIGTIQTWSRKSK
jgi:mono/diheme cytochrome c family protein